jgi:hypothetical protein
MYESCLIKLVLQVHSHTSIYTVTASATAAAVITVPHLQALHFVRHRCLKVVCF